MNGEYKCEHSKLFKIYIFGLKTFIYNICLENKQIIYISKKNKYSNEKILFNNDKQIYEELLLIKAFLEKKFNNK